MATAPVEPKRSFTSTIWAKALMSATIVGAIIFLVTRLDFRKDLSYLDVKLLSGSPEGHYNLVAQQMSDFAARQHGKLVNVSSEGTVDNLRKLAAGAKSCEVQFGLAQDGADFPKDPQMLLIGRLPRAETVFLLGKNADAIDSFSKLSGRKIGIGPDASGTARLAHQLFDAPDLKQLSIQLSNHPLKEQIDLAAAGQLDLAMFVMDEDAPLIQGAIREKGLQMVGFPQMGVLAKQVPHLRTGTIPGGQFDPVKLFPPQDKQVLQVETLVVSNGCASRSQTIGIMDALTQVFPDFMRHNRDTPNLTGLKLAPAAKSYFEHEGPEVFDEYAPWLVDVMPPGNWVYLVTGVSILFNIMGFGHRFRLWQLDVRRVKLDSELSKVFGPGKSAKDIFEMDVAPETRSPQAQETIRGLIVQLEALAAKARKESLSMLVPMGQEMAYRYQEDLMHEMAAALRAYLQRTQRSDTGGAVARAS